MSNNNIEIKQPLVSVIVPVFNVEKYISKCIDSLLKQTYLNFEAIIVDDGSQDSSMSIAKEITVGDSRFKFVAKINGGLSSARNYGVKFSSGDLISFLDSDDYFHETFLESMVKRIVSDASDVVVCSMYLVDESCRIIERRGNSSDKVITGIEAFEDNLLMRSISSGAQNKVYKRDLVAKYPYPDGLFYEDRATTYKMFLASKKVSLISDPLFFYVQRKGSIMNGISDKKIFDRFVVHESIEAFLSDEGMLNEYFAQLSVCYLLNVVFSGAYQIAKFSSDYAHDVKKHKSKIKSKYFTVKSLSLLFMQHWKKCFAVILYMISPVIFKFLSKGMR